MADNKQNENVPPAPGTGAKDKDFNPNPNPQTAKVADTQQPAKSGTKETLDAGNDSGSVDAKVNPQPSVLGEDSAAANRTPTEQSIADSKREVVVTGNTPGGPFNIDGPGFGNAKGQVTINGRAIETTRWIDRSIRGQLPADVESGEVVVKVPNGTERRGTFTKR